MIKISASNNLKKIANTLVPLYAYLWRARAEKNNLLPYYALKLRLSFDSFKFKVKTNCLM